MRNMSVKKRKAFITLSMIVIVRLLAHIPVPWVDTGLVKYAYNYSLIEFSNIFSGGAIERFSVGAVGLSAYISASILFQILSFFIPSIHKLSQSASGQYMIKRTLWIAGIILSPIYSFATVYFMNKQYHILIDDTIQIYIGVAIIQCIGAIIYVSAGNIIDSMGIGNGVSTIIYVNILASIPSTISSVKYEFETEQIEVKSLYMSAAICLFVALITFISGRIEYRFPLSVPYDTLNTAEKKSFFLPFKVSFAGVMPMIYAQYLISAIRIIGIWIGKGTIAETLVTAAETPASSMIIYIFAIIIFTVFIYKSTYDYDYISHMLNTSSCIIYGLMPGIETKNYIKDKCLSLFKWQLVIYVFIAFIPEIMSKIYKTHIGMAVSIAIVVDLTIELSIYIRNERQLSNLGIKQQKLFNNK